MQVCRAPKWEGETVSPSFAVTQEASPHFSGHLFAYDNASSVQLVVISFRYQDAKDAMTPTFTAWWAVNCCTAILHVLPAELRKSSRLGSAG